MALDIEGIKKKATPILKRAGVKRSSLFGSFARGEANKRSDIDILVECPKETSLLDFIGIKLELEKALKRKVDLVEYDVIKPRIRQSVLSSQVPILSRDPLLYIDDIKESIDQI